MFAVLPRLDVKTVTAAAAVTLLLLAVSQVAAADRPAVSIPDDVVIVSSTTFDEDGAGPFTMTATNIGTTDIAVVVPAPASGAITVDQGAWNGTMWSVDLAAGATATMLGVR